MSRIQILKAASIITMDPAKPRAEAVAVDTKTGEITAVGSLAEVQRSAPGVVPTDLGDTVLMPGFIDPHSHPLNGGMVTQAPAYWIAPYAKPPADANVPDFASFTNVVAFWQHIAATTKDTPLVFNGLDRLLQGAKELTNEDLDGWFGTERLVVVLDNSGHEAFFNSAVILSKWPDRKPDADPKGGSYGRYPEDGTPKAGTSNGRANESPAIFAALQKVLEDAIPDPLMSGALWYKLMASNGITMTTEHTYQTSLLAGYAALALVPDSPLRMALYHMSNEPDFDAEVNSHVPKTRLWKQGIKLWADGSPWVGTMAASFPYLDTETVRKAQIPLGPGGMKNLNYPTDVLDSFLDENAPKGWQFAFHVNGDVGLDVVLDAYEKALGKHGLLGTDHRWRVEHCGGCRGEQFTRAAALGVMISLPPFQFIYWGDLLDGKIFSSEIGSQWVQAGDAMKTGAPVSFHNDGCVSPPIPLLNIQCMVTRRTPSGTLHGPRQAVSLDDALKAHTVHAAYQLRRDHDLGSISVGKLADFVELSADPYTVDIEKLTEQVAVRGTWSHGRKIDLDRFIRQIAEIDRLLHLPLLKHLTHKRCC